MKMTNDDVLHVWLNGEFAGELHRTIASDGRSQISFQYDAVFREGRGPRISASMPKSTPSAGIAAGAWIDNLLPDNDAVRERWAKDFGERRSSAFNLLRHMGMDCPGAVQIAPEGELPGSDAAVVPLSPDDIDRRIARLHDNDSTWRRADDSDAAGRWSLGGAQGKFALARDAQGNWFEPTGRAASTHILKIGVSDVVMSDVAEYVTMRAAGSLGLDVAPVELARFGAEIAVVVQRFDRRRMDDGTVNRIHQEDFCQALGIQRERKYEADGGPGITDIAALLRDAVDPRDLRRAREQFALSLAFNWLTVGTDAHAKNFALLHRPTRTSLAPLYDLIGGVFLDEPGDLIKAKLAMRLGTTYEQRAIESRHWDRLDATLGLPVGFSRAELLRLHQGIQDAVDSAISAAGDAIDAVIASIFRERLAQRVAATTAIVSASSRPE
jgi:serine/threonine-protein kinase HipA